MNMLEDQEVRQGVKDYSNWPTMPQRVHPREFVGSSDIMMDMSDVRPSCATGHRSLIASLLGPMPTPVTSTAGMAPVFIQNHPCGHFFVLGRRAADK